MASTLTDHYLALFDPDQVLIDDCIAERVEQLQHAQRTITMCAFARTGAIPAVAAHYRAEEHEANRVFWHLDADLALLAKHSFPHERED